MKKRIRIYWHHIGIPMLYDITNVPSDKTSTKPKCNLYCATWNCITGYRGPHFDYITDRAIFPTVRLSSPPLNKM